MDVAEKYSLNQAIAREALPLSVEALRCHALSAQRTENARSLPVSKLNAS
jgi:hypothetical protein